MDARFAQLRKWLALPPTPETWKTLLLELASWPDQERQLIIDYIHSHVTHWPDEIRTLPNREWLQLGMGRLVRMYRPNQKKWRKDLLLHLHQMPNLTILDLNNRHVGDELLCNVLDSLEETSLKTLNLHKNILQPATFQRLRESSFIHTLESLSLSHLEFQSLDCLQDFPLLQSLSLSDCRGFCSLAGLEQKETLRSLYLHHCSSLESISHLNGHTGLEELILSSTNLRSFPYLSLPSLTKFSFGGMTPIDSVPFPDSPALKELTLHLRSSNQLELENLFDYSQLESFHCQLRSLRSFDELEHLQKIPSLKKLYLHAHTGIDDRWNLPTLESLEELSLSSAFFLENLPFESLPSLRVLRLNHLPYLSSLQQVLTLPALEELHLNYVGPGPDRSSPRNLNSKKPLIGQEAIRKHVEKVG